MPLRRMPNGETDPPIYPLQLQGSEPYRAVFSRAVFENKTTPHSASPGVRPIYAWLEGSCASIDCFFEFRHIRPDSGRFRLIIFRVSPTSCLWEWSISRGSAMFIGPDITYFPDVIYRLPPIGSHGFENKLIDPNRFN